MGLSRKRTQLQAYFAGIIDGEGHIGIHRAAGTWNARVYVQMDDPEAVMLLSREYPEAAVSYRTRADGKGKPYYAIAFNHYKAFRFLEDIKAFLIVKQRQAKIALSFLAHRRRDHAPTKGFDCGGRCERFHDKLRAVRAEAKGVKSVNALLEHELREYRAKPEEVEADVAYMRERMTEMGVPQEGVETRADALHGL